ncbi:hypothetical protein JZ751_004257 [Albula glossodonta]|uniref:Uncharacterized protein n=1 Tax=Albula glossodonta TaxID=121402 RepID=A0A8T2NDE2_9TELE|nr:hypothetical protein JZ751_004257 [Albula glossodonta]
MYSPEPGSSLRVKAEQRNKTEHCAMLCTSWLSHKETRATRTTRREPPSAVPPFSGTGGAFWKSMAVWEHDGKKPSLYLTKMGI